MKALIVVDYQNDFVTGSLGFEKAKDLEGPICEKIEEYLARNDLVLFTKDCHDPSEYPSTLEGKLLPIEHCASADGAAI
ncbi:MAG: isochorismatase family protein, partial [Candidatus Methanomethylophilaceae archaeon]|nr:isochorismatase family protein [Candidatus Methanomethylophilaceae archaeon]